MCVTRSVYHLSATAASLARGVGEISGTRRIRSCPHLWGASNNLYNLMHTPFPPFCFYEFFLGHLCLIMGKPQIGHFVAANEDFPEFKPPKVARVGFVGYLTINYLPTHVLPNIILHYTFLHYNIIFQHHLTINHLPRRVTQHPTTTPILCMRWG